MTQPSEHDDPSRPGRWLPPSSLHRNLTLGSRLSLACSLLAQSTHYMGFFHALLNQPSRSYSLPEPDAAVPAGEPGQHERAARKAQYYSAAADPNLRKEWERILQDDSTRARATPSLRAGVRSIPISPLRHQAFVVSITSCTSCRTAYGGLISGPARPSSGN
jgi:hypothetical protein